MADLVLGTAQFGDGYGITNRSRRLDDSTVEAILTEASLRGITMFDTAADYGASSDRLSRFMPDSITPQYVTKFSLGQDALPTAESIYGGSMRRLRVKTLYGLLIHRITDLEDDRFELALGLARDARAKGTIQRLGVSVYDPSDLELAISVFPDLDLIQIPGSIVDARLTTHPFVGELHRAGVEIHVRSAFLQGLLLQGQQSLQPRFEALQPVLSILDDTARRAGTTRLSLLLGALRSQENVDKVVVGATSRLELRSTIEAWASEWRAIDVDLPELPTEITDPRLWV